MPARGGDPRRPGEQGQVRRIGCAAGGVLGRRRVQPAGLPGELAELVAAERDVGRVERGVERTPHERLGPVEPAMLFEVVRGAGVGGESGPQVEHPLHRGCGRAGVAELGLRIGEHAVRAGGVTVDPQRAPREVTGRGEVVPGVGKSTESGEGGRVAVRADRERAA